MVACKGKESSWVHDPKTGRGLSREQSIARSLFITKFLKVTVQTGFHKGGRN